jgi:hypothetical protein
MNVLHKLFGAPSPQTLSPAQGANPAIQEQVAAQNAQPTPGNIPAQNAMPASATNPTVPASSAAPEGLDKYKDMWSIPEDQMPKPPESAFAGVTPEAIAAVAAKTDFTKAVTPEMMQAISAGGEGAVAAMIQAMNAVAQKGYSDNAQASIKLIETALEKQRGQFEAALPNLIKQQNVNNNLRSSNPIFNHPAAIPMLETLQKQLQLKNPTADAATIQQQAEEFLISFATTANPPKPVSAAVSKAAKDSDWDSFMQ